MAVKLIIESGTDYRELLTEIEEEGYERHGRAGHTTFELPDGTTTVYSITVDCNISDETQLLDFVQEESDGAVEARPLY